MNDTKQRILQTARDLFLREGMGGLSMRKIASDLGFSAAAIYRHFADKDELLRGIVDMSRDKFLSYLRRGLEKVEPRAPSLAALPVVKLREMGRRYIDFGLDNGAEYAIMFMSWDKLDARVHSSEARSSVRGDTRPDQISGQVPETAISPPLGMLLRLVAESLGEADEGRIMETAVFFWSHVHGLVSLYLSGGGVRFLPPEEYRQYCYRQVDMALTILKG
jgi:AcrR family transcriptional regulator